VTTPQITLSPPSSSARKGAISPLLILAALTTAVLFLYGYHPFAYDAGIYVAGIRKLADPSLYRPDAPFVLASTRLSAFPHFLAAIVRYTRAPLEYVLLATHLASIFACLFACWTLARRIFASPAAQWFAVALAGACFTLPIAGTAILIMDPYVTSRSFSTPLGLFALTAAIDHGWARVALFLVLAALMHPLMALYAAAFVLLFILIDEGQTRAALRLSICGVIAAGGIYLATLHLPVSPAYSEAVLSRSYLFPSEWPWFEYLGLAIPLLLYAVASKHLGLHTLPGKLCLTAVMMGTAAALSAFLFVHPSGPYFLVRLQPLRSFHILYMLAVVLLGGLAGELLLNRSPGHPRQQYSRWAAFALLAAVIATMLFFQRGRYPFSAHVEWPGQTPRNPWQQAFLWIRANTPQDAVFAAAPELVFLDGEDSQGFRATTGRSLLADDKDEGLAILYPQLIGPWAAERNAQSGLDHLSDSERVSRLRPFGATWLLLSRNAATSLPCPYRNAVAQVCCLRPLRKGAYQNHLHVTGTSDPG
jgi:hypothetical protein